MNVVTLLTKYRATEFLPLEYSTLRNMSEKVYKEQLTLSGYTRQLAQEVYIHTCSTLPTSTAIFFPVKVCVLAIFNRIICLLLRILGT